MFEMFPYSRSILRDLESMGSMMPMWTHETRSMKEFDYKQYRNGNDCIVHLPVPGYSPEQVTATYHPEQAVLEVVGKIDGHDGINYTSEATSLAVSIPPRFADRISVKVKNGQAEVTIKDFYADRSSEQPVQIPVEGDSA